MRTSLDSTLRTKWSRRAHTTTCKIFPPTQYPCKFRKGFERLAANSGCYDRSREHAKALGLAVAAAGSWLALNCPPSIAGPTILTSVAAEQADTELTVVTKNITQVQLEGAGHQGTLASAAATKAAGISLAGIVSTADCLSAAAHDLVNIKTGNSDLHLADVAGRMSQQALALASEAVQLMSVDLPEAERRLVEQISEAAQLVSIIADGIVAQEAQQGNAGTP